MDQLSKAFKVSLPWELLYADDLALMSSSLQDLENKYKAWKESMETKGLRVNTNKTKVMVSRQALRPQNKTGSTHAASVGKE